MFPVDIAKCFKQLLHRTPQVATSDSPITAQQSQLGCLFFDFTPPHAFDHCTNNSLLSYDKMISSLLELIDHMLSILEQVLEKH